MVGMRVSANIALKVEASAPTLNDGVAAKFGVWHYHCMKFMLQRGGDSGSGMGARREGEGPARVLMAGKSGNNDNGELRGGIVTKTEPKTKKPSLYKVLLLNDDYTPMDFVVFVLERFFNKPHEEANRIMMHVHQKGVGICGVYTYEVAETKVAQVMNFSRQHQHPLQCTMEKE
jgi:ATP-dependent Clp protease adaptor protein ClpS